MNPLKLSRIIRRLLKTSQNKQGEPRRFSFGPIAIEKGSISEAKFEQKLSREIQEYSSRGRGLATLKERTLMTSSRLSPTKDAGISFKQPKTPSNWTIVKSMQLLPALNSI